MNINVNCECFGCTKKADYIIIWNGKGKPAILVDIPRQYDAICREHYKIIIKHHKGLIQTVIDFCDEKVLLI